MKTRYDALRAAPDLPAGSGCDLSPDARWGRAVRIGRGVRVGPHTVIHDETILEDGAHVGPGCVIGEPAGTGAPAHIGTDAVIRSGSIIYADVILGAGFQGGNRLTLREGTRIGEHCVIGTATDVQADVTIGAYTRIHSQVHLAAGTRLGRFVWILPGCLFTNDNRFPLFTHPAPPVIGDFSVLAAGCLVFPGARLGVHVVAAAGAHIKGDFADYAFIQGAPARVVCDARRYFTTDDDGVSHPYPWIRHVARNYPWKDVPPEQRRVEDYLEPAP